MVITFRAVSMVATKLISEPLEFVFLRVIKLPTVSLVSPESSVFLIASLKVSVMLEVTATPVSESAGLKVIVGAVVSSDVVVLYVQLN